MADISKTAQVLRYFAQHYQLRVHKGIPRTRLMKMAYLSDFLAREYLGRPITSFAYYRYTYGPYDDAIVEVIKELEDAGLGETKVEWDEDTETKRLLARGMPTTPFEFSAGELELMRYVATTYLHLPLKELLDDVVYKTLPMLQDVRMEDALPMDMSNGKGREAVGFDLEDMLRAEQEIAAGQFVTSL